MALGQPFDQQFKAGDVVYGISQARVPYINSLPMHVAHHLRSIGQFLICDEFNNRTFGTVNPDDFLVGLLPDTKKNIRSNLAHHEHAAAYLNPLQKAALSEYYDALKGTRYAPMKAVQIKVLEAQAKGNQNVLDLVFRRACKFGLQFVIEQKKGTIHFVLDVPAAYNVPGNRIDNIDVVTKGQHANHVPITTSELRCCYRNRATWIPSGRLKFYFNLLEVNPPWVDEPAVWAIYEAHRITKGRPT
jgi:hypothetical protein